MSSSEDLRAALLWEGECALSRLLDGARHPGDVAVPVHRVVEVGVGGDLGLLVQLHLDDRGASVPCDGGIVLLRRAGCSNDVSVGIQCVGEVGV